MERKYSIPSRIAIRIPGPFDITSDFQSDEIPVYEGFFESGYRDRVSFLAEKVSEMLEISPGQLNPPSWRTMIAIQNLDVSHLSSSVGKTTTEKVLKLPIERRHIPFLVSKEALERCSIW
ncbi:hypothetical protein F2Q70_00039118 [Brassica cretica]|uniref:Uncharacterized protein n=1 Tax=Brassica cretica TaxID=69181 RepID=A0A8S9K2R7_BRACR|nr:hypothetical protein F2Q70_00039118 [Brassica cretica]